jgi:two-component system response regulator GlrR
MKTILLVEDEIQQREILQMMFESEGFEVMATSSAEEAFAYLRTAVPQLIVSDVKLGGVDGISMFEQLRKDARLAGIPFIFITGYNDPVAIERVRSFGSAEYVTKPYDLDALLERVRKQLPPGETVPTGRA